ncbi:MAG: hypothetical protein ACI4MN_05335 [Candidatus Coproplasma sp.]
MLDVKKKDGTSVDFQNNEDLAQLLLDLAPDNGIRSMLFETRLDREPTTRSLDLGGYGVIKTMKRIINTAYVVALCRWKQLKDTKNWSNAEDEKYFENSRFTKLFQSALSGEDVTIDLQIFSLMELWVEFNKAPRSVRTRFGVIFNNDDVWDNIGLILQSTRNTIKNATFKRNNDDSKYTKRYCNELCYMLLNAFMLFFSATVTYPEDNRCDDPKDFCISYEFNTKNRIEIYPNTVLPSGKLIATEEQILIMAGKTDVCPPRRLLMYIRTETSAFDGKLQHTYTSFDGERQTFLQAEMVEEKPKTETFLRDIHETRKFLSFSYRNIRELAMILNDSIKHAPVKRRELFEICKNNYPKIIADIKDCEAPNIYWDNIITLMLLEMGVSDFLEKILCEEELFYNVLKNIAWRNKGMDNYYYAKNKHLEDLQKIEVQCNHNPTVFAKQKLKLRIKTVLEAMDFDTEDDDNKNPFLESLSYKYEKINSSINELTTNGNFAVLLSNANQLQELFSEIFMFLQVFYVGLDSYTQKQMELNECSSDCSDKDDDDGQHKSSSKAKKHSSVIRNECYRAFVYAARGRLEEIKDQSLTQLFDGFCELCSSYNTFSIGGEFNISEKAKRLKYAITRNYVCDANKLRYFVTVQPNGKEKTTVFEVLGNLQKYYSHPMFSEWLTYLKDVFMFLIYNEDYNERGLWKQGGKVLIDKDCDPIYPYIVTYYKENIDRDNVKKCTYRVPLPVVGSESEGYVVTLLTDEEYTPQTYYCIPLRYGSSDRWWINPFLIPKSVIKEIGYPESDTDTDIDL